MKLNSKKLAPKGLKEALSENFVGATAGIQKLIPWYTKNHKFGTDWPRPKHLLAREVRILSGTNDCDYTSEEFEDSFLTVEYYGPKFIEDAITFFKSYADWPNEKQLFQIYKRGIKNVIDLPF